MKRKTNLLRYFELFVYSVVAGSLIILYINLSLTKKTFDIKNEHNLKHHAIRITDNIDNSLVFVERFTNLIAEKLSHQKLINAESATSALKDLAPRIEDTKYDLFTWTFFDFITPQGEMLATTKGKIKNSIVVDEEKRSYMRYTKITPWKLIISKSDIGLVSGEHVIPVGFGITNKKKEFIGIISMGIHVNKLKILLEKNNTDPTINFILLNKDNSIISASENVDNKSLAKLEKKIPQLIKFNGQYVKTDSDMFYYLQVPHYPDIAVLVSLDKKIARGQFLTEILPDALNTLYLTGFFLILLYFFKTKLLNPVVSLSEIATEISEGNTAIQIPESKISEMNSLSNSIKMVRNFIEEQQKETLHLAREKFIAEKENENKTEFLSSTVHELKNIIVGIVGLAEIMKSSLNHKIKSKENFSEEEMQENKSFIEDIIKLGEELSSFIHDIIDVNQVKTGTFNIEEEQLVDIKIVTLAAIKLLKIRAIKNKKHIVTHFLKSNEHDFLVRNLDSRIVKQILVNLISNSIKYARDNSEIEIRLEVLDEDVSEIMRDSIIDNLQQNQEISKARKRHLLKIIEEYRPKIIITIKDRGDGMDEDEVKIAMQRYGKIVKNQDNIFIDSSGLGLPIVKHLVELQGGMIKINSQKGVGTEVKIIF